MEIQITLTAKVPIRITKKRKWFLASCPALDVATQGETEELARKNIAEALEMFLRSCIERGTLDVVLKQCGFKPVVLDGYPATPPDFDYVDIPLHLLSQFEENCQCHHA